MLKIVIYKHIYFQYFLWYYGVVNGLPCNVVAQKSSRYGSGHIFKFIHCQAKEATMTAEINQN